MESRLQRFLGGSPLAVLVKLIFLSMLVGAVMAFFNLTPAVVIEWAAEFVRSVLELGFEAFGDVGRWILYGAVIVVPLWLLSRILARR